MEGACADGECQAVPIDHPPTTVGWAGCATQKPLSGFANGRGADRVADADEAASKGVLSPIDSAKAVQIKRIGKVFDINPDPITTGDVLNKKSAFAAVVDGFLLDHEAALGLATHGEYELWGGDVGIASFLNPARAAHLQRRLHLFQKLTPQSWAADVPMTNDELVPTTTVGVV